MNEAWSQTVPEIADSTTVISNPRGIKVLLSNVNIGTLGSAIISFNKVIYLLFLFSFRDKNTFVFFSPGDRLNPIRSFHIGEEKLSSE